MVLMIMIVVVIDVNDYDYDVIAKWRQWLYFEGRVEWRWWSDTGEMLPEQLKKKGKQGKKSGL